MRVVNAHIETRKARARLRARHDPHYRMIEPGLSLGYRKPVDGAAGTWVARWRLGRRYRIEVLRAADGRGIVADDLREADGFAVLSFAEAQVMARATAKLAGLGNDAAPGALATVKLAVDDYENTLRRRGGNPDNADRIRCHLPAELGKLIVAKLRPRDFDGWNAALDAAELAPATINRMNAALKAALNLAAKRDPRIERTPWDALERLDESGSGVRNVILPKDDVLGIVGSAYQHSTEFGLLCEVVAQTGARPVSQAGKLKARDLKIGAAPKLQMPASKKGRGEKKIKSRPVPITLALALRLQAHTKGKPDNALLLTMPGGAPWQKSCHARYFKEAVKRYKPDLPAMGEPDAVTIYAFRHTAIVRELMDGVPIRVVAAAHDTSVRMIEKHYSAHITDHSDELSRSALLETGAGNVVALHR